MVLSNFERGSRLLCQIRAKLWHNIINAWSHVIVSCVTHTLCCRYFNLPSPLFSFQKVLCYSKIALDYQAAIDKVLWNEDEGIWLDYDTRNKQSRNAFYPSNLSPLYTMSYNRNNSTYYALKALSYLKRNRVDLYFGKFVIDRRWRLLVFAEVKFIFLSTRKIFRKTIYIPSREKCYNRRFNLSCLLFLFCFIVRKIRTNAIKEFRIGDFSVPFKSVPFVLFLARALFIPFEVTEMK